MLMKSAERELLEIERKKQAADNQSLVIATSKPKTGNNDAMRQRVQEITQQIAEESKRLAATRAQLQRLRKSEVGVDKVAKSAASASTSASVKDSTAESKPSTEKKSSTNGGVGRLPSNPVPEELYPELCRYFSIFVVFISS
jgi:hypothetical protein